MDIRNVAIIAHVDHGKTTLVDCLLKQSGTFRDNQQVAERAMDSNDLERERGITILAKATSVVWKGTRVNIVDTPGHADFGGEVERILSMVDGVVLLVDAAEGPLPPPKIEDDPAFRMLVTTLESDPFLGRILTGRILSGTVKPNTTIKALARDGHELEQTRITKVLAFRGLERMSLEQAEAGDIVAVAGLKVASVADTIGDFTISQPIPSQPVDPPTLAMTFAVNDSPLAGTEGDKVTTRMIRARLMREGEGNVAIRVRDTENADSYEVAGRGELQLGVLIETMRREGFELAVGRPRVLFQNDPTTGQRLEPIEEVVIDVDDAYTGVVVEQISVRKGELQDMRPSGAGKTRLVFYAPSRGLIGYHGEFLTDTRGTGVMNRIFHEYGPYRGTIAGRRNGALIANAAGNAVMYAMWNLEERGPMFIDPGIAVYQGMLIGEHSRGNDLEVNVLKGKQLTNIRAAGKDEAVRLTPPRKMSLEQAIAYIEEDELVEITPKSIRLRKRFLEAEDRKRARKQAAMAAE